MLIHSIYFWLKDEVRRINVRSLCRLMRMLDGIDHISAAWLGTPAAITPRPTVDDSYDYALTPMFADSSNIMTPIKRIPFKAFVVNRRDLWSRVQIYDSEAKRSGGIQGVLRIAITLPILFVCFIC